MDVSPIVFSFGGIAEQPSTNLFITLYPLLFFSPSTSGNQLHTRINCVNIWMNAYSLCVTLPENTEFIEVEMKNRLANIYYAETFATYWMAFCLYTSFASVFLLANGYSNTEIGILIAAANLLSVVIQPVLADITDRSRRLNIFEISGIICLLIIFSEFFTCILTGKSLAMFLAYTVMLSLHAAMQPLLNSMNLTMAKRDIIVNYGVCRGIGSLGYSVMSVILSALVAHAGIRTLPVSGEISMALLLIGCLLMNSVYKKNRENSPSDKKDRKTRSDEITLMEFVKRHRMFILLTLGIFLMYYSHQVINYFMLQIFQNVGGGSTEMGFYYAMMTILEIPPLFAFSWLLKKFRTTTLLKIAVVGFIVRIVTMTLARSSLAVTLTLISHPFGFPLFLPAIVQYINEIMDPKESVRGQSVYVIVITLSAVVTTATGGRILDLSGASTLLIVSTVTCLIGAAIIFPMIAKATAESRNLSNPS